MVRQVRRRNVLIGACGLLLSSFTVVVVSDARAQGEVPRVAILFFASSRAPSPSLEAFRKRLRDLGYIEGQNLILDIREADGQFERYPALLREIVQANPKVIVVSGSQGVKAAMAVTSSIAIVATSVGDPVEQGFALSLGRPGKNVTGNALIQEVSDEKTVEILHEIVPRAVRVAVLANPAHPIYDRVRKRFEAAAAKRGLRMVFVHASNAGDVPKAFADAAAGRANALIVANDGLFFPHQKMIVDLAARHRIATVYPSSQYVDIGGLMSYSYNGPAMFDNAAVIVDRILKGQKPAEIAFEQPTRFELVINRKAAKALGLKIPQAVLLRADRVVE